MVRVPSRTVANTAFYLFTTAPGNAYFDDLDLRPFIYFQQLVMLMEVQFVVASKKTALVVSVV